MSKIEVPKHTTYVNEHNAHLLIHEEDDGHKLRCPACSSTSIQILYAESIQESAYACSCNNEVEVHEVRHWPDLFQVNLGIHCVSCGLHHVIELCNEMGLVVVDIRRADI